MIIGASPFPMAPFTADREEGERGEGRGCGGGGGRQKDSTSLFQAIHLAAAPPIRIQNISTFNHGACYLELW